MADYQIRGTTAKDFEMAEDGTTLKKYIGEETDVWIPGYVKKIAELAFCRRADLICMLIPLDSPTKIAYLVQSTF